MATRILSNTPFGRISIKVDYNGWSAQVGGKTVAIGEIAQKYHEEIRRNVKEVCEAHNWEDMSDL